MKPRVHIPSPEEAQKQIAERWTNAKKDRERFQPNWAVNERAIYSTHGVHDALFNSSETGGSFPSGDRGFGASASNSSTSRINLPYAFKNLRYLHAQMSANPPSVTPQPSTSDPADRDAAQAADMLVRWGMQEYKFGEIFELCSLNTLLYGSGFIKIMWDGNAGEPLDIDEETGEIDMEGDISIDTPSPWDVWFDPDARKWSEVDWVFQRIMVSYNEACSLWPDKKELFKAMLGSERTVTTYSRAIEEENYDSIELVEYWETGQAHNGYLGKYAIMTAEGKMIEAPRPNPHRFKSKGANIEKACLPFYCLTDVDVPATVWGKSAVDYAVNLQDTYNRLLSHTFDAIQAHGSVRGVFTGSMDNNEDVSNSNWEIMETGGAGDFYFVQPPKLMADINQLGEGMKQGIDDMMGINDAMMGKMERETAGFALQYAASQGHLIRRRLFNKYQEVVKGVYETFLMLIRDNWEVEKVVKVAGDDNLMESMALSGSDIASGFDLIVEYGRSMSLDPITRREEMMALMPLFEKAGVPPRVIVKMLQLSELQGVYDILDLAEQRQKEIIEAMIAAEGALYVEPEEFEDHENMLAYALYYVMTAEYRGLEEPIKEQIREHIRARKQLAGKEKAGASGAPMQGQEAAPGAEMAPPGPQAAPEGPPPGDDVANELMAILGT